MSSPTFLFASCCIISAWDSGCGPSLGTGAASADLDGLTIKLLLEPAINCVAATTDGAEVPLDSPEEEILGTACAEGSMRGPASNDANAPLLNLVEVSGVST
jgi:hypothetical protein